MISDFAINRLVQFLDSEIAQADMVLDGETLPIQIIRTEAKDNTLIVFTNSAHGEGEISDIMLKDSDGNTIISNPKTTIKQGVNGFVSTFYIRIVEEEIQEPVDLFEFMKGRDA